MAQIKVVTIETAQKLKEAGFPQESHFFYVSALRIDREGHEVLIKQEDPASETEIREYDYRKDYAAPFAEEVLSQLPEKIKASGMDYYLDIFILIFQANGLFAITGCESI